jgi:hypothetical protein
VPDKDIERMIEESYELTKSKQKKVRIKYLIVFTVLLSIEVLIAIYVHDTFIRPYVGDMLVVIVCIVQSSVLSQINVS